MAPGMELRGEWLADPPMGRGHPASRSSRQLCAHPGEIRTRQAPTGYSGLSPKYPKSAITGAPARSGKAVPAAPSPACLGRRASDIGIAVRGSEERPLLSDAETGKNSAQEVVGTERAGDFSQGALGLAEVFGNQFA